MPETFTSEGHGKVPGVIRLVEKTGDYAFLIGAGTSKPIPSDIETANELVEIWQKNCYKCVHQEERDPSKDEIKEWARSQEEDDGIEERGNYGYWFERFLPDQEARRKYIQDRVEGADPTTGHLVLASMMSNRRGSQYVPLTMTPNFDDLLLNAFYLLSAERPQVVSHEALVPELQFTSDDPAILKLHGDYLYEPLNIESETGELDAPMSEALERTVDEYGLIVVGYSGRDDSIMSILEDAEFSDRGLYWCVKKPEEDDEADTVEEKISDRVADLVRETGGEVVSIEGFNSLMSQFSRQIDDLPSVTNRGELQRRFENRLDRIDMILEERQDAETGEAEEELLDAAELSRQAYKALEAGESQDAKELYDKLIESEGPDPTSLINRGVAKADIGEYEDAIDDYNEAIELNPEYAQAYNNRGYANQMLGEYGDAIDDYSSAIELNPENLRALQNRIEVYIELGKPEKAKNDAEMAIRRATSIDGNATSLLLYLISSILLEEDTQPEEREYRNLCQQDLTTTWNFTKLDDWLENTDLEPEKESKVNELRDLLREHKPDDD